jgi:hypothetical protein
MAFDDWYSSGAKLMSSLPPLCILLNGGEHQDHPTAAFFAGFGACSPFSVSESKGRAGGHLCNAGDLPEGLGWGAVDHRRRGLRCGIPAVKGAMKKVDLNRRWIC